MWEGADYLQIRGSGSLLSDQIERKITLRNDERKKSIKELKSNHESVLGTWLL